MEFSKHVHGNRQLDYSTVLLELLKLDAWIFPSCYKVLQNSFLSLYNLSKLINWFLCVVYMDDDWEATPSQVICYVTGRQPFRQPFRLFKIWNLPTNQVPGRNLNIWIEICWMDSQILFVSLSSWMFWFNFGLKCFKTYLNSLFSVDANWLSTKSFFHCFTEVLQKKLSSLLRWKPFSVGSFLICISLNVVAKWSKLNRRNSWKCAN